MPKQCMDSKKEALITLFKDELERKGSFTKALEKINKFSDNYIKKNKIRNVDEIDSNFATQILALRDYIIDNIPDADEQISKKWVDVGPSSLVLAQMILEKQEADEMEYMYNSFNDISKDNLATLVAHIMELYKKGSVAIITHNEITQQAAYITTEYKSSQEFKAELTEEITRIIYVGGNLIIIADGLQYGYNFLGQNATNLLPSFLNKALAYISDDSKKPYASTLPPLQLKRNIKAQANYLANYGDLCYEKFYSDNDKEREEEYKQFLEQIHTMEKIYSALPQETQKDISTVDSFIEALQNENTAAPIICVLITKKGMCKAMPTFSDNVIIQHTTPIQFHNLVVEAVKEPSTLLLMKFILPKKNESQDLSDGTVHIYGIASNNHKIYPLSMLALNKATAKYIEIIYEKVLEIPYIVHGNFEFDTDNFEFSNEKMTFKEYDDIFD